MAADRWAGRMPPVVANGVVYIAAEDGTLCALKATAGQKLASIASRTATPLIEGVCFSTEYNFGATWGSTFR